MEKSLPRLLTTIERYRTKLSLQDIVMYGASINIIESIFHYNHSDYRGYKHNYYTIGLRDLILNDYMVLTLFPEELDTKLTYIKKTPNLKKLLNLK